MESCSRSFPKVCTWVYPWWRLYAQVCTPVLGEARVQARLAEHIQPTQAGLGAASPADTELVTVLITKLSLSVDIRRNNLYV